MCVELTESLNWENHNEDLGLWSKSMPSAADNLMSFEKELLVCYQTQTEAEYLIIGQKWQCSHNSHHVLGSIRPPKSIGWVGSVTMHPKQKCISKIKHEQNQRAQVSHVSRWLRAMSSTVAPAPLRCFTQVVMWGIPYKWVMEEEKAWAWFLSWWIGYGGASQKWMAATRWPTWE